MEIMNNVDYYFRYDWGRLNLQSVTEEDSYQDFLNTAEMAGREFDAEKWNVKLVDAQTRQVRMRINILLKYFHVFYSGLH